MLERKQELGELISIEMGKSLREAIEEVELSASIVEHYAVHGPSFITDYKIPSSIPGKAVIEHRPIGSLVGIMPWNFPYYQVVRFAAPNLLLGNTVLLKHAEICPSSSLALESIFHDAGVARDAYRNVFVTHDQIANLIADPRIQGVSITGSARAGSIVASLAGKHLKKCVLELGGIDAMIVLDSADVPQIARDSWRFRSEHNAGQVCNSNKRLIVMDSLYDAFVEELVAQASDLRPGDPLNLGEGEYVPLSSRAAAETVNESVQRAVADGARLLAGGKLADGKSAYFSPAVLVDVPRDSEAFNVEMFGPVATVFKVSSEEEVIELANDSPFGLGGSAFSESPERAQRVAARLNVGMTHANTIAVDAAELPFGEVKGSGFGREMGPFRKKWVAKKGGTWGVLESFGDCGIERCRGGCEARRYRSCGRGGRRAGGMGPFAAPRSGQRRLVADVREVSDLGGEVRGDPFAVGQPGVPVRGGVPAFGGLEVLGPVLLPRAQPPG